MDDRVGTLSVHVRTDVDGRDGELRDLAERFTREVIEKLSLLLETRAPGRLVMLQHLPVRWTLPEHVGDSVDHLREQVERAAEALVIEVEAGLPTDGREPEGDAVVAVFASEAAWIASALRARATGEVAWFHRAALRSEPLERLIVERTLAFAVLGELVVRGALIDVLAAAPPPVVARLADVVCADVGDPTRAVLAEDAAIVLGLVERLASWPSLAPAARRLAAHSYARAAVTPPGSAQPEVPPARIAGWAQRALAIATPLRAPASLQHRDGAEPVQVIATSAPDTPAALAQEVIEQALHGVVTNYAGVFYLLSPILELGLAETLWQTCLPEGALLANALGALIPDDDPALATIAGVPAELPAIDDGQLREVATATIAALVSALPRGGRAALPPGYVRLVDLPVGLPGGRLLVVTAIDAPFVWFAHPVSRSADALDGIAGLRAHWPATTPLYGDPALIELDRSGRLRHPPTPHSPPAPLLVAGTSHAAVALASIVVGAPCQLVVSRTEDTVADAHAWGASRLARPARIVRAGELIEVWQPADAVDLELRAAGIDRDPGYIPWLAATVRLRFED